MKIVLTPDWFLGKDVMIEGFSFIVLFAFFLLCIRNYKLTKKKNSLYLGVGFLFIAIAQLAVISTKLILYYDTTFTQQVGKMIITYNILKSIDIFYYVGFFFHRLFTLIGFYIIYRLPRKKASSDFILALYFIIISALFSSTFYYLFHLTTLILLLLIIDNYYNLYKKNKFFNTKILIIAFSIIALGHLTFAVSKSSVFYVIANVLELIGYLLLLLLMIRILKHGKKKKSYGNNIRHFVKNKRKRRKD